MSFFYQIFIFLLAFGFRVGSVFNQKIKSGFVGRKQSFNLVKQKLKKSDKVIWMHAASLGEYEQGLPVLECLKAEFPQYKILVTFFSPSGYDNVVKKNHFADVVCYLPFDDKKTITNFVSQFQTEIFFTVKYDFWYHLFRELKNRKSKIFVISALFYPKQIFFKPYGKWFVNRLAKDVDWFFHQTKNSCELAKNIGLKNSSVSGDTRFDRVRQIRERDNNVPFIQEFKTDKKLLVFGSSWEAEERIAKAVSEQNQDLKIIIAPHDLKRVEYLKKSFQNVLLYSEVQLDIKKIATSDILIIDSIGLLSKIYAYADLAVVGGGFHSAGLHNILEAATFGIPVVFGNQYKKNPEADALIEYNGGKSFTDEKQATDGILSILKDEKLLKLMSENSAKFVYHQPYSTEIIFNKILSL
ncbi:MAG: glycosyltransferase N-terminal domain-containing protein [Cruoricaptor ignavus]|nr:glycosyltransferase N-terminal domain-containing protein [Cruoricaptor ignavus]